MDILTTVTAMADIAGVTPTTIRTDGVIMTHGTRLTTATVGDTEMLIETDTGTATLMATGIVDTTADIMAADPITETAHVVLKIEGLQDLFTAVDPV